jgi:hypothetical protein
MVRLMKKLNFILLAAAAIFIFTACNDPIFYTISREVKPIPPRIDGTPANIVFHNLDPDTNAIYTATGSKLYSYVKETGKSARWRYETFTNNYIVQIASTGDYLYTMCIQKENLNAGRSIRRFDGNDWERMNNPSQTLQYIFAANDVLFIGTSNSSASSFSISYLLNGSNTPLPLRTKDPETMEDVNVTGEISGAAWHGANYYISTKRHGIFTTTDFSPDSTIKLPLVSISINEADEEVIKELESTPNYVGMINLDGKNIVAIARSGELYHVNVDENYIRRIGSSFSNNRRATGVLAVYTGRIQTSDPEKPFIYRLLLAGRQDTIYYTTETGYTYGYLEIELDETKPYGIADSASFREPGISSLSTVSDNERFRSTIGKNPVNSILQPPFEIYREDRLIFASTQKSGLWSYRHRGGGSSGGWQWNAEQ